MPTISIFSEHHHPITCIGTRHGPPRQVSFASIVPSWLPPDGIEIQANCAHARPGQQRLTIGPEESVLKVDFRPGFG